MLELGYSFRNIYKYETFSFSTLNYNNIGGVNYGKRKTTH